MTEVMRYSGINDDVIDEIRKIMRRRGLSYDDLADLLPLKRSYIARRLAGTTVFSLRDVEIFAMGLGVDPHELMFPHKVLALPELVQGTLAVSA